MDPYDLFNTPPGDTMLSSTPAKRPRGGPKETTPFKLRKNNTPVKITPLKTTKNPIQKGTKKAGKKGASKKENVWDKHLKENPELAQFVDEFNHSLEEATSKPLDIET